MKSIIFGVFLCVLLTALIAPVGQADICDTDTDGDVDREDIRLIFESRNRRAEGPDDPRDVDGNGYITVMDGRRCVRLCTYADCAVNSPPEAVVSGPQTDVCVDERVTLDGSGSLDEDFDPLSFHWVLAVPAGSMSALSDETAAMPTFVTDVVGVYTAELAVNDGLAFSEPVSLTLTAVGVKADAGEDQLNLEVGEKVTLDGSNSTSCVGLELNYFWELFAPEESAARLSDPTAAAPTFTVDVPGRYEAMLVVDDGTASETDAVIVDVDVDEPGTPEIR